MPTYASKIYREIGHCIYCGATEALQDEHIIPFSLNGNAVLPKASCASCATVTGRTEQYFTRGMFWPLRTRLEMQTRRPKDRPATFKAHLNIAGTITHQEFKTAEHPVTALLATFQPPGLFRDEPPGEFKGFTIWSLMSDQARAYLKANPGTRLRMGPLNLTHLSRMLAKIAHGFAIAELGEVFSPLLPPIILEQTILVSHLIGGQTEIEPPTEHMHAIGFEYRDWKGHRYLVVRLRLLSQFGGPTYRIVTGEVNPTGEPPRHLSAG